MLGTNYPCSRYSLSKFPHIIPPTCLDPDLERWFFMPITATDLLLRLKKSRAGAAVDLAGVHLSARKLCERWPPNVKSSLGKMFQKQLRPGLHAVCTSIIAR